MRGVGTIKVYRFLANLVCFFNGINVPGMLLMYTATTTTTTTTTAGAPSPTIVGKKKKMFFFFLRESKRFFFAGIKTFACFFGLHFLVYSKISFWARLGLYGVEDHS